MAKHRAKRLARKEKKSHFWIGAFLYAVVALVLIGMGLNYLWDFLSAYEVSRPGHTVDSYMETLTPQHILDLAGGDLVSQVDDRLRDEAGCRAQILASLSGEFTCARNISRSSDRTRVYVLRLGSQVIGSFRMEQVGQSRWNFTPWEVTGEEFDLSYLLGETVNVVAPDGYTVLVNGLPLPRECVVEEIPYPQLSEIAGSYELPTMLRYEAGPLLAGTTVTMTDQAGRPVDTDFDPQAALDNCVEGERAQLEETIRTFLTAYVDYTSRNIEDLTVALNALKGLMIPDGELAHRMTGAQNGLSWIPRGQTATITNLEMDLISRLEDGLYFCDVTFAVDTTKGFQTTKTVTRAQVVFRRTGAGLLAETMIII